MVFRLLLLSTVFTFMIVSNTVYAQQIWKFSVLVAVEKQTADYYQKVYSKDIRLIVNEQIATVNANFNTSNNFNGRFSFQADSIYVFEGSAQNEIFKLHSNHNYKIIINGFSNDLSGGGWYGTNRSIYHNWKWDNNNGPFGKYATDGLTHEFGHARGAIDIYGLKVDAQKNLVNSSSFEPINSIMNYPYDNIKWDEHTIKLLNSTGSKAIEDEKYITSAFPNTLGVKVINSQGIPLNNAAVEVYPVEWFSYGVASNPLFRSTTNDKGVYQFLSK